MNYRVTLNGFKISAVRVYKDEAIEATDVYSSVMSRCEEENKISFLPDQIIKHIMGWNSMKQKRNSTSQVSLLTLPMEFVLKQWRNIMFENDKLKTGIRQLDDMLEGGLPRGEFMLIGGRPGMGKTSLLKQIMKNSEKTVCLYLSDDRCFDHLTSIAEALCQASNYECFVVLDDLDRFKVGEEDAGFRLKTVAKQFNIPVIGAVKLPRDLECRKDKRPDICDFHKGFMGMEPSIEKDADVILGLYRESYYNIDFSAEDGIRKDEIIVVKNRHGKTGTIDMSFDGRKRAWEEK